MMAHSPKVVMLLVWMYQQEAMEGSSSTLKREGSELRKERKVI